MGNSPVALELRRMQMLSEVGTEQNTTTIIMIPSEFVNLAQNVSDLVGSQVRLTEPVEGTDTVPGVRVG